MKRAMVVLLAGIMTLGLAACGGSEDNNGAAESKGTETYQISYNLNTGNTTDMPDYQFLGGDISGMLNYEARLYTDISLVLNEDGTYDLTSDTYTISGDERIEVGASDGIGMVCIVNAEGTYVDNGDGTVTTSAAEHVSYELETDVYSQEMVAAAGIAAVEGETSGKYDSDETSSLLEWVPETVFTLGEDRNIVTYTRVDAASGTDAGEEEEEGADVVKAAELLTIPSDDGATTFTLYDDGSYRFYFESYQIEDLGTYKYDVATSVLTIADANGTETVSIVDGENIVFKYIFSQNEQLTGDFTVSSADVAAALE